MMTDEQAALLAYPDDVDDYYCCAGKCREAFLAGVRHGRSPADVQGAAKWRAYVANLDMASRLETVTPVIDRTVKIP